VSLKKNLDGAFSPLFPTKKIFILYFCYIVDVIEIDNQG